MRLKWGITWEGDPMISEVPQSKRWESRHCPRGFHGRMLLIELTLFFLFRGGVAVSGFLANGEVVVAGFPLVGIWLILTFSTR